MFVQLIPVIEKMNENIRPSLCDYGVSIVDSIRMFVIDNGYYTVISCKSE